MNYISVKEAAEKFHISSRRVQQLCDAGRINGVEMISGVWLIPESAQKPSDERITAAAQTDDAISLTELCKTLSISVATGRNWIKLGKLTPQRIVKRTPFFSPDYVKSVQSELAKGKNTALKSRRNKKYISGNNIYHSYVSENSAAPDRVQSVLNYIAARQIDVDDVVIKAVVAECAIQLILHDTATARTGNCLQRYLKGTLPLNNREFLIDDIIEKDQRISEFSSIHSDLFKITYNYEENEDILGLLYISLKNLGTRKASGAYYTPTKVVKKLCTKLFETNTVDFKKILDPCCGTGNFLLQLPPSVSFDQIYGNDTDILSVKIARINSSLKYKITDSQKLYTHITAGDYLNHSFHMKFDYIIGNPPWGYEYSDEEKKKLRGKYCSATGSNIESYDVFLEQALSDLCLNGILSFVLPEALLNVKSHAPIRRILTSRCSFQYLEFLGNAFDKVHCPCMILQLVLTEKPFSTEGLVVNDGKREYTIHHNRTICAECMTFSTTDEEYAVLSKIQTLPNIVTLKDQASFALGIVTGDNKKYISSRKHDNNEMILRGSDLYKFKFCASNQYIIFNPDGFQQIAPVEYYRAEEKLLYRFICNQLVFAYDDAQTLSLNSCNILIPRIEGLHIKYVMAILNSRIAQFYFKKQFHSVKVLRSHIEQIPIPYAGREAQETIIRFVDAILQPENTYNILELYNQLDAEVAVLYELCEHDYQLIQKALNDDSLFLPDGK